MKRLFQIIPMILLAAYNNNSVKPSLKQTLANGCYWDRLDREYAPIANMCFKFNTGSSCLYFDYLFYNHKKTDTITLYYEGDNILPKTWSVQGDTLFIAQGMRYPVIRFTSDSIYSKWSGKNDTVIFTKNCNSVRRISKRK